MKSEEPISKKFCCSIWTNKYREMKHRAVKRKIYRNNMTRYASKWIIGCSFLWWLRIRSQTEHSDILLVRKSGIISKIWRKSHIFQFLAYFFFKTLLPWKSSYLGRWSKFCSIEWYMPPIPVISFLTSKKQQTSLGACFLVVKTFCTWSNRSW